MQIKLLKLQINNFKAIKKFTLDADGRSIIIQGKNGIGKTSLADAWFWTLTGSNADGQAKYNIIELDDGSIPVNHQNAEVEAIIEADGKKITLHKTYRQKWTKKRGQADAEFSGHTTDHRWDGVDVSAKEYQKRLDELCPAAVIRSLTDVHHFCGRMKADDRRQELISIAGEINMQSICAQYSELNELPELIGDYSLIDFEKMLKSQRKQAQKSLHDIPIEINSKKEEMPDIDGLDEEAIRSNVAALDEQISGVKNELVALSNGLKATELKKEKMDLEAGLIDLENRVRIKANGLELESSELFKRAKEYEMQVLKLNFDIQKIDDLIAKNRHEDSELVAAWKEINSGGQVCRTCGQQLPREQVKKHLDDIAKRGSQLAAEFAQLEKKMAEKQEQMKRAQFGAAEATQQAEVIAAKSEKAMHNPEMNSVAAKIADLEQEIKKAISDIEPEKKHLEAALSDLEKQVGREREKLLSITQAVKTQDRIRQKEKALKLAAAEFEDCERKLYLLELYGRKRSEYIEETVSQKFEITSWKLFEEQINAGSREICEPVYQGVPYSTDLNTGAKIQVGLDVIRTLSKHHSVTMPVFIDNAESVTNWMIDLDNQMIRLAAAPNVEKLEVIGG
jgi:DNA repair exonuclease SbcCD ATPase subunit